MVWLVALNVKADPHPDGIYGDLLTAAAGGGKGKVVQVSKYRAVEIADVTKVNEETYVGHVWSYTVVDRAGSVVDLKGRRILAKSEVDAMLSSEWDDRGLNHSSFVFGFNIAKHMFVYERSQMSPWQLANVLEKLFNNVKLRVGVDDVTVAVVQDEGVLEKILKLKLTKLEIRVTRPNPDDLAGLSERLRRQMQRQDALAIVQTLEAEGKERPLKPSDETKQLATIAVANGTVSGHGWDDATGRMVDETTAKSPMAHPELFDPAKENAIGFMGRVASVVGTEVKRRMRELRDRMNLGKKP